MNLKSISASAIKTFETCPRKFHSEYILKKKPPTHPAAAMGSCLHSCFEESCKAKVKGEDVAKQDPFFWMESKIKEFDVLPEYHKTLKELMQNCIDWNYMDLTFSCGFEKEAKFILPCGIEVHGFIDRLDIDNDWKANIIDLKTQKDAFDEDHLDENWQSIIYYLATLNDNPMIQGDVTVSYWVLRHRIQKTVIAQSRFDELLARLDDKTREIMASDGTECKSSGLCNFCIADCPHKNKPGIVKDFSKKDLSTSARQMKDYLASLKNKKLNIIL